MLKAMQAGLGMGIGGSSIGAFGKSGAYAMLKRAKKGPGPKVKTKLEKAEVVAKGRAELSVASKVEKKITEQAETIKRGRNELKKAKAEFDKLNEQTVFSKEGENVTARVHNIVEQFKENEKVKKSSIGGELLRQSLRLQENIDKLQKQAEPETKTVTRKGKPPVVEKKKAPAVSRTVPYL